MRTGSTHTAWSVGIGNHMKHHFVFYAPLRRLWLPKSASAAFPFPTLNPVAFVIAPGVNKAQASLSGDVGKAGAAAEHKGL